MTHQSIRIPLHVVFDAGWRDHVQAALVVSRSWPRRNIPAVVLYAYFRARSVEARDHVVARAWRDAGYVVLAKSYREICTDLALDKSSLSHRVRFLVASGAIAFGAKAAPGIGVHVRENVIIVGVQTRDGVHYLADGVDLPPLPIAHGDAVPAYTPP